MSLFVISYDLIKFKDYPKLWEALEKNKAHRVLDSVWLLTSNSTPNNVRDWLAQYTDSDDKIFVAEVDPEKVTYKNAKAGTNNWMAKAKEIF